MSAACSSRAMRYAIVLAGIVLGLGAGVGAGTARAAGADTPLAVRDTARVRKTSTATSRARNTAVRRLEPTHIAGEIPVPQVLFITARDQRRFMDFHHQRYLRTSRQLADATPIPTWMAITRDTRREVAP